MKGSQICGKISSYFFFMTFFQTGLAAKTGLRQLNSNCGFIMKTIIDVSRIGIISAWSLCGIRSFSPRDSAEDERETCFRAENNAAGTAERWNLAVRNFRTRKVDRESSLAQVTRTSLVLPDVVLSRRVRAA